MGRTKILSRSVVECIFLLLIEMSQPLQGYEYGQTAEEDPMVDASETQEDDDDHDDIDEDDFHEAAHHDFSTPAASLIGDHDTMLGARAGHGPDSQRRRVLHACTSMLLPSPASPGCLYWGRLSQRCLTD